MLDEIARNLKALPISPSDMVAGYIRVRTFKPYYFFFFVGANEEGVVVTICRVDLHDPKRLSQTLANLGQIAILRGATGI